MTSPEVFNASIEVLTAADILPLRTRILRPNLWPNELAHFEVDELDTTVHCGIVDRQGQILACVTFHPQVCPTIADRSAIRLRGMAVDTAHQKKGYGSRLVEGMLPRLALKYPQDSIVWCNARVSALEFYKKLGFHISGEEFEIEPVGPHFVMWRELPEVVAG